MKTLYFKSPTGFILGNGLAMNLAEYAAKLGMGKVLMISDPMIKKLGVSEKIMNAAKAKGISFTEFSDVEAEPPVANTNDGFAIYKNEGCEGIVGLGGGSAMDVAKAVAMLAANPGKYQDFVGVNKVPRHCAPLILIPTTSGTGSEVSMFSIMMVDGAKAGVCDQNITAHIALVDPELTLSVPRKVTAATGLDTFCHLLESYLSNLTNPMASMVALEGIAYTTKYLRKAVGDGNNLEARYWMSYASSLGGYCCNLTDGCAANHGFAFALGGVYHTAHGLANAIMLPWVFPVVAKAEMDKVRGIGVAMGENMKGLSDNECLKAVTKAITDLVSDVGCLIPLSKLGGDKKDIDRLVEETNKQTRVMGHSSYKLTSEEIAEIYHRAF